MERQEPHGAQELLAAADGDFASVLSAVLIQSESEAQEQAAQAALQSRAQDAAFDEALRRSLESIHSDPPPPPPPPPSAPSEDSVYLLVGMGFEKGAAQRALYASNNNVDAAVDKLLAIADLDQLISQT